MSLLREMSRLAYQHPTLRTLLVPLLRKLAKSNIVRNEVNGIIVVTGPYMEMKDVFPHLKAMGFRYNNGDRSWSIHKSYLKPGQLEKLDELVPPAGGSSAPAHVVAPSPESYTYQDADEAIKKLRSLRVDDLVNPSYSGESYPGREDSYVSLNISVPWLEEKIESLVKQFSPGFNGYRILAKDVNPHKLDRVLPTLENVVKGAVQESERFRSALGNNRQWKNLEAELFSNNRAPGMLTLFIGSKKEALVKPALKVFKAPYKVPVGGSLRQWHIYPTEGVQALHKFIDMMDELNVNPSASPAKPASGAPTPAQKGPPVKYITNTKGGTCQKCGGWVDPGMGWAWRGEDDDERQVWFVKHKYPEDCI